MYFITPENATQEQVEAVVQAGMEAIANGERNVAILHWGSQEHKDHVERMEINGVSDLPEDSDGTCEGCGEDPCVFSTHEEQLTAFDVSEHGSLVQEEIPENNIRRKKLYRQLTLMID